MEWFFLGNTLKAKAFMIASTLHNEGAEQESGAWRSRSCMQRKNKMIKYTLC
jgi:hypothetical protein